MKKLFIEYSHYEKMLSTLPKKCSCSTCNTIRLIAQEQLGERRYKELAKKLDIRV